MSMDSILNLVIFSGISVADIIAIAIIIAKFIRKMKTKIEEGEITRADVVRLSKQVGDLVKENKALREENRIIMRKAKGLPVNEEKSKN